MDDFMLSGNIVDVVRKKIFPGEVHVEKGRIVAIHPTENTKSQQFIMPGFIDAHIHIESSMLVPSEFARLAVIHGTVATISDPHEIANVLGLEGVRYMIESGKKVPFHFYFGAPSCVPATPFETAGATIDVDQIEQLFQQDGLVYLSEMMNYPGVLAKDPLVMQKIALAKKWGLPIDGHAPGLVGEDALHYINAGISTDHECFSLPEALGKIVHGMQIIIREGSAAKNYEALHPLIKSHPTLVMFGSDDKHPHELIKGHINEIVKRSIQLHGYDVMDVLRCACYNPVQHYKLDVGFLQEGQSADFIVVDNLHAFNVQRTYIKGKLVAANGQTLIPSMKNVVVNRFETTLKEEKAFSCAIHEGFLQVIQAIEGELVTNQVLIKKEGYQSIFHADTDADLLKIAVVNRYGNTPIAMGVIQGMGLKKGAIASCIAHDSHNIIAVGTNDRDLCRAVNMIIHQQGGISLAAGEYCKGLPLPVAGIMSHENAFDVAANYAKLDLTAKEFGSSLSAPFMTLSFMALLVIPSLKISDQGLFDCRTFNFTPLVLSADCGVD